MLQPRPKFANPFGITKAVDLNDDQIQSFWVSVSGDAEEFAEYAKPASPMPTYILGAKGSGKTHLMRYHAFELQTLRYRQGKTDIRDGVAKDGYIGVYVRCSGLNSERFAGKRQSDEKWAALFAYYIELWLTQNLLEVLCLLELGSKDGDETALCSKIMALFDKVPEGPSATLADLSDRLGELRRNLDYAINNCVMTGELTSDILFTRGKLIFGIPRIVAERYDFLRNVLIVYSLDEFENLTEGQQKFVNTLVREKELPSTIRIGSRLYGVKTHATMSDNEENQQNSEFEVLPLDALFRLHKERYSTFAKALIEKRLTASYGLAKTDIAGRLSGLNWAGLFETTSSDWDSPELFDLMKGKDAAGRRHFVLAREKLIAGGCTEKNADAIIKQLSADAYPLLEKACLLHLYQEMFRGQDPVRSTPAIVTLKERFLADPRARNRLGSTLDHYKKDLIAQLYRENDSKQQYLGLDTFIRMSAGLPRGLLTILRSIFDWAYFRGEDPVRGNSISKEAQLKGVKDAADWFYDNMRKAGDDGVAIQTAIDRLARLFRANRFSDKPTECSLIAFSFPEVGVSPEAMRILRLAESRSFLNRIPGGQRDKNNERVMMKFQLNNMLSPRWDLPLGRRGAFTFEPEEIDWIFDPAREADFQSYLEIWREKRTAPFFGKRRSQDRISTTQPDLF